MSDEDAGVSDVTPEPEKIGIAAQFEQVKKAGKNEAFDVYRAMGLVDEEGNRSLPALAVPVYEAVKSRIVNEPRDRATVAIRPSTLMEELVPDVTGPDTWVEIDDPDDRLRAEIKYDTIRRDILRVLDFGPDGLVQAMLSENGGYQLCRTKATKGREIAFYVTHNYKAIVEDATEPALKKAAKLLDQAARISALSIDRVPERADWFARQFTRLGQLSLEAGKNTVEAARDAATSTTAIADDTSGE